MHEETIQLRNDKGRTSQLQALQLQSKLITTKMVNPLNQFVESRFTGWKSRHSPKINIANPHFGAVITGVPLLKLLLQPALTVVLSERGVRYGFSFFPLKDPSIIAFKYFRKVVLCNHDSHN